MLYSLWWLTTKPKTLAALWLNYQKFGSAAGTADLESKSAIIYMTDFSTINIKTKLVILKNYIICNIVFNIHHMFNVHCGSKIWSLQYFQIPVTTNFGQYQ